MLVESNLCKQFYNHSCSEFQLGIQKNCAINIHLCTTSELIGNGVHHYNFVQIENYDGGRAFIHSITLLYSKCWPIEFSAKFFPSLIPLAWLQY